MYGAGVRSDEVLATAIEIAREQGGYVSVAQLRRLGVDSQSPPRLARSGLLRRVTRGVYALPGVFGSPFEETIAAWLRLIGPRLPWETGDPDAIASHATAAYLQGLGTFFPTKPAFTSTRRRNAGPDVAIEIHFSPLADDDWRWLALPEGIRLPITTPARTIVDLALNNEDREHVLDALAEARTRDLATAQDVVQAYHRRRRRTSADWLVEHLARSAA
jgi:predicted transcriptional regulator of viral defense system